MGDKLEAIKDMFDEASIDDKNKFLFKMLILMRDDMARRFDEGAKARAEIASKMEHGIKELKSAINCVSDGCGKRQTDCIEVFVTKKQSRLFGIIVLIGAICFGVGAGYISFLEAMKHVAAVVP